VFSVSVKVKLTVPLLCVCVHSAWKGRPRNDLYCVGWDVKPYSLTQSRSLAKPVTLLLIRKTRIMVKNAPTRCEFGD